MFLYLLNFPLGKNILRGIHAAYLSLRRRKRFKNLKTQISNVIKWTACCQARSGVHEPGMNTVMWKLVIGCPISTNVKIDNVAVGLYSHFNWLICMSRWVSVTIHWFIWLERCTDTWLPKENRLFIGNIKGCFSSVELVTKALEAF